MAEAERRAAELDAAQPAEGGYFVSTYPPFASWDEAGAEAYAAALSRPADPAVPLGLYLHVPFCQKRCDFCYYLSYDRRGASVLPYLEAVERELRRYRELPAVAGRPLRFAYFGGGTPSLLSTPRLAALLGAVSRHLGLDCADEVTFECAPASTTKEKLVLLRQAGVTRVSLGVQQLDDAVLRQNGRAHGVEAVRRAYAGVREVGFAQVNLDLIVGLVGQTDASFAAGLEAALALAPDSLTLYLLEVPHNTPLFRARQTAAADLAGWAQKRARLEDAYRRVAAAGYAWRSAYTAVRDPAHAFLYQDLLYAGAELLGVGASSFGLVAGVHQQNLASLSRYLESPWCDGLPLWRGHALTPEESLVRDYLLQLKLGAVDHAWLSARHGAGAAARFDSLEQGWRRVGLARREGAVLRLTWPGLARVDQMLLACYLPQHRALGSV